MVYFIIGLWILSIGLLYVFFNLPSDLQQLIFLGSLGGPLTLPLTAIVSTVLYLMKVL